MPIVDHDPSYLNEIRICAAKSFPKPKVMLAKSLHVWASWATLACTTGSPSKKRTLRTWPLGHFLASTRAAYDGMSAPAWGKSMQQRIGLAIGNSSGKRERTARRQHAGVGLPRNTAGLRGTRRRAC